MRRGAARYRDRIRVERPVSSEAFDGAGSGTWETVIPELPAEVQDVPPSRSEKAAEGVIITNRLARVRVRYREDIASNMRFVMGSRKMQIISGPAEIGNRDQVEFMVEEFTPAGNPA